MEEEVKPQEFQEELIREESESDTDMVEFRDLALYYSDIRELLGVYKLRMANVMRFKRDFP